MSVMLFVDGYWAGSIVEYGYQVIMQVVMSLLVYFVAVAVVYAFHQMRIGAKICTSVIRSYSSKSYACIIPHIPCRYSTASNHKYHHLFHPCVVALCRIVHVETRNQVFLQSQACARIASKCQTPLIFIKS